MTDERLENLANELLNRFNLPLYQLRRCKLENWEKQFYADSLKLNRMEFSEVINFIKSDKYQPNNRKAFVKKRK